MQFQANDSAGTYWYHGHNGQSRGNGLFGAFVIIDPSETDKTERDNDFLLFVNDWYAERPEKRQWLVINGLVGRSKLN